MKRIVLLVAAAALCQAQEFSTGQAARLVIGQKPFTAGDPGASNVLLGSAGGLAYANDTLVVADSNGIAGNPVNHRVLIYNNVRSFVPSRVAPIPQGDPRCPACVGAASVVLGQPDFSKNDLNTAAQNSLRKPVGVAYNGRSLAVADTDNNRVLIWRNLPVSNQQNADLVVGQKDFISYLPGIGPDRLRGPEGVWLDANNGLWVADTGNSRVLYYSEVTQNGQAAKFALGQPNLNGNQQTGLFPHYKVDAGSLYNPTSVTTNGTRVLVTDLGNNRVLIWNSIPSQNGQPADVVLGQPDMTTRPDYTGTDPINTSKLCDSNGTDANGKPTYPARCARTLEFPRYALSDGKRLFVADGGNDRVLVWNSFPTQNAQPADLVLGQQDFTLNQTSDSGAPERVSSTDSFRTPTSLAWDGENLYVTDTFNRRVVLYTPGDFSIPVSGVRNAASPFIYAKGTVTFGGTLEESNALSIKIGNDSIRKPDGTVADPKEYKFTTSKLDTFATIIDKFVELINAGAGDPNVLAIPNKDFNTLILKARAEGVAGNSVNLATAIDPTTGKITMTTSGANLSGGQNAARIAPYAIVTVLGDNLTDVTTPVADLTKPLPTELGGVEFYVDGIKCPLLAVAPDRVLAQVPVATADGTSSNGILRVRRSDGSLRVSAAVAIPIIGQNPAVYSDTTLDPKPGLAYHYSNHALGTVSVDGSVQGGDVVTITIRDRSYSYTVQSTDTLSVVRDNLIATINGSDPEVEAFAAGPFQRIRLRARVPGPEGNGIPFSASAALGAQVIMSAFNQALCCANQAGAPVTQANPALPGETIVVLATGLGVVAPDEARQYMFDGKPYDGPAFNTAAEFVSSLIGGKTANVLFAGLKRGAVGVYEVHLELNPDMPTNPYTEGWIAQSFQVSNIFTIAIANPKPQ